MFQNTKIGWIGKWAGDSGEKVVESLESRRDKFEKRVHAKEDEIAHIVLDGESLRFLTRFNNQRRDRRCRVVSGGLRGRPPKKAIKIK